MNKSERKTKYADFVILPIHLFASCNFCDNAIIIQNFFPNLENNLEYDGEHPVKYRDSKIDTQQGYDPEDAGIEYLEPESGSHLTKRFGRLIQCRSRDI